MAKWLCLTEDERNTWILRDLVGLDTALLITESLHQALGNDKFRPCQWLWDRVAAGHYGRKTGQGFCRYDNP